MVLSLNHLSLHFHDFFDIYLIKLISLSEHAFPVPSTAKHSEFFFCHFSFVSIWHQKIKWTCLSLGFSESDSKMSHLCLGFLKVLSGDPSRTKKGERLNKGWCQEHVQPPMVFWGSSKEHIIPWNGSFLEQWNMSFVGFFPSSRPLPAPVTQDHPWKITDGSH